MRCGGYLQNNSQLWEKVFLVRRLTIPDLVFDANINTLVELSDVQFTEGDWPTLF
jgi:hypothetical protein